jgi:hypothetical protein
VNNLKTEPMVKHSNQVHTTTDYFLFKPIEGNRNKNLIHLSRLKKSLSENYLFTVIIVNEKYEIIDGQHRFECVKELKLPLHYIVCNGYGLNEVHVLNQNSKTWNAEDYLTGVYFFSNGWKGVYLPQVVAEGHGPVNWVGYFNQQTRWSYGLFEILFKHSYKHFFKLTLKQKINIFYLMYN